MSDSDEELEEPSRKALGLFWGVLSLLAPPAGFGIPVLGFLPLLKDQLFLLRIHTVESSATIPSIGAPGSGIGNTSASVVP